MRIALVASAAGLALSLTLSVGAMAAPEAGRAAPWRGSIKVSGKHSDAELAKMAKVDEATAAKAALAAVKAPAARKSVTAHEVEAENGYLVYSMEVKVKGHSGIEEVLVDAGNGKVLSRSHESPAAEKGEAAGEKENAGK